jgi:glycerophosphoryl diester phosphodiesterase
MSSIIIEGHRGYCAAYPENTLISYEAAIDMGVDAFEFDIWLSADKVPVLMHDQNALRTCGVNRNLREMTLEEIRTLNGTILISTHAIALKGCLEYLSPSANGSWWSVNIRNCDIYGVEVTDGRFGIPKLLHRCK